MGIKTIDFTSLDGLTDPFVLTEMTVDVENTLTHVDEMTSEKRSEFIQQLGALVLGAAELQHMALVALRQARRP